MEKPTYVLIHGWTVNSNVTWVVELTTELLNQSDCNVITVDYTAISELDYLSAVNDVPYVGKCTILLVTEKLWD